MTYLTALRPTQAQSRHNLDIKTVMAPGGPPGRQRVSGRKLLVILGILGWRKRMGIEPTHQLLTGTLDLKTVLV